MLSMLGHLVFALLQKFVLKKFECVYFMLSCVALSYLINLIIVIMKLILNDTKIVLIKLVNRVRDEFW